MPVARIYASLVEEAEPICADLLARGYNVEVVFPDAVLSTPADLELRVERCSAEQAIARVEAGGSPSRCVFVTPAKGPRRELLLVEMTVLATGTDGRHPIAMPGMALVSGHMAGAPVIQTEIAHSPLGKVVPFPSATSESSVVAAATTPASANQETLQKAVETVAAAVTKPEQLRSRRRQSDQDLSKDLIAELNVFLAHAPVVEPPEGLYVRIFENVRNSAGAERARKNWESLTLAGVAASLMLLLALGWYAAPDRARRSAVASRRPGVQAESAAVARPASFHSALAGGTGLASAKSVALETHESSVPLQLASAKRRVDSRVRRQRQIQDDLIAQDHVARVAPLLGKKFFSKTVSKPAPTTSSALIPPAPLRSALTPAATRKSAPIKIITDLR
jgi:hypothetical protein